VEWATENGYYSYVITSVGVVAGTSGTSGTSGVSGSSGTSGSNGSSGTSGGTGASGSSGTSGTSFESPYTGDIVVTGSITTTGNIATNGELSSNFSSGNEGGQINLALAQSGQTLTGSITLDVFNNKVRLFEEGGTNRGGYWDISTLAAGVGTNLAAGGGGGDRNGLITTGSISADQSITGSLTISGGTPGSTAMIVSGTIRTIGGLFVDGAIDGVSTGGGISLKSDKSFDLIAEGNCDIDLVAYTGSINLRADNSGKKVRFIGNTDVTGSLNITGSLFLNGTEITPGGGGGGITQITGVTFNSGSWSLSGSFLIYDYSNTGITTNSVVSVIPSNASIGTVIQSQILPQTDSSAGSVRLYASYQPSNNITATINIQTIS
jgi:hypothetical protein